MKRSDMMNEESKDEAEQRECHLWAARFPSMRFLPQRQMGAVDAASREWNFHSNRCKKIHLELITHSRVEIGGKF